MDFRAKIALLAKKHARGVPSTNRLESEDDESRNSTEEKDGSKIARRESEVAPTEAPSSPPSPHASEQGEHGATPAVASDSLTKVHESSDQQTPSSSSMVEPTSNPHYTPPDQSGVIVVVDSSVEKPTYREVYCYEYGPHAATQPTEARFSRRWINWL